MSIVLLKTKQEAPEILPVIIYVTQIVQTFDNCPARAPNSLTIETDQNTSYLKVKKTTLTIAYTFKYRFSFTIKLSIKNLFNSIKQ